VRPDRSATAVAALAPTAPTWSVLIVSYQDAPALSACLAALEQQRGPGFETVVVDNAGDPVVAALVAGRQRARLLSPGRNTGYGGGNNLAASVAAGEYLLILNPDVLLRPQFLQHMADALAALPAMALVTATLLQPDGRVNALGNALTYTGITTCRHLGDRHYPSELHRAPAISGAAFATRRRDFERLGGFDEEFSLYLEDTDLSLRALLHGGGCWCTGQAVAVHDYHWRFSPGKQGELETNRLQLVLKVYQGRTLLALAPGLALLECCVLAYALVRGPAYLRAKLKAYGTLVRRRRSLLRRRRQLQGSRVVGDSAVLGWCNWRLPLRQQLGAILGTALAWLLAPAFYPPYAAAGLLARLYDARSSRSPGAGAPHPPCAAAARRRA
jgi:GT2 family glycosyltransferase